MNKLWVVLEKTEYEMLEIIGNIDHELIRLQSLMPHVTIITDEGFGASAP